MHIWDQLLIIEPNIHAYLKGDIAIDAFNRSHSAAEEQGYPIYEDLKKEQAKLIARQRDNASYSFSARRKSIDRIGLPEVRNYRLNILEREENALYSQLEKKSQIYPDLIPLLLLRVEGGRQ